MQIIVAIIVIILACIVSVFPVVFQRRLRRFLLVVVWSILSGFFIVCAPLAFLAFSNIGRTVEYEGWRLYVAIAIAISLCMIMPIVSYKAIQKSWKEPDEDLKDELLEKLKPQWYNKLIEKSSSDPNILFRWIAKCAAIAVTFSLVIIVIAIKLLMEVAKELGNQWFESFTVVQLVMVSAAAVGIVGFALFLTGLSFVPNRALRSDTIKRLVGAESVITARAVIIVTACVIWGGVAIIVLGLLKEAGVYRPF